MSSIFGKNNLRKALSWIAILLLLIFLVLRSNLEPDILIPFIILGITATVLLSLIKGIKLPRPLILFSCIFSSLTCCGFYFTLTFLFEKYFAKSNNTAPYGGTLILASSSLNLPGIAVSILAYPIVLVSVSWIISVFVSGFKVLSNAEIINEIRNRANKTCLLKHCFILLINLSIAIILAFLLISGAYSLPMENIERNTASSAELLYEEGTYPSLYKWCFSRLDNFTDSLILLEAADKNEGSSIENALLNYNGSINGYGPVETLYAHYAEGKKYDSEYAYPRYWHGNLVVLKPLLEIMNYKQIRMVNIVSQSVLVLLICILLTKRNRKSIIIPFLLTYLMLMPVATGKSLQFSSCFYVSMISTAILLCRKKEHGSMSLFLFTGAATAYFDLLTYPIVTIGIPATVYIFLYCKDSYTKNIIRTIHAITAWSIGYAGLWISKWIITEVLTAYPSVSDSIKALLLRTSSTETGKELISVFTVFGRNITSFLFTPVIIPVAVFLIFQIIKCKKGNQTSSIMLPVALICILPFVWYALAGNHSFIHYWFTNKALAVSLFAILCYFSDQSFKSFQTVLT